MPAWLLPMARGWALAGKFSAPSLQVKAVSDVQDPQYFTNEACVFSSEDSILPLLHLVEVYTTPEISPHDSPAGSSLRLSQGPNCLSRLGHTRLRGEPWGWRAQPGQLSSAAGSQEPSAQKVQPHPPLRANNRAWASSRSSLLWPEQRPPPQAPRAALRLQLGSPMRPGNCKSQR
ncbi:unnamed protein product [Rangifer tarandus platyrhynchus]|uniref:Uncharacterized protein n=1 Tax=Rangifer tarandus platyrhynchus TaxID=3082113 RepID=A0ABN8Y3U0_RANTA|nr:unnamed protein product [Rangifer tarandus platyrhynchus]